MGGGTKTKQRVTESWSGLSNFLCLSTVVFATEPETMAKTAQVRVSPPQCPTLRSGNPSISRPESQVLSAKLGRYLQLTLGALS